MSLRPRSRLALARATILAAALGLASTTGPAQAAKLRLSLRMEPYSASPAYLAVYVADHAGHYVATVRVFGDKVQFYPHLSRWFRGVGPQGAPLDGVTGASVGSGEGLDVSVEIADALIDAGYQIRVDSAVEKIADEPAEIVIPLERDAAGRDAIGRGLVAHFRFDM